MWEELKKTALLGTDRHQIPEKELAFLEKMQLNLEQDPSLVLLDALAMWSKMKKVGVVLPKWDKVLNNSIESTDKDPTIKLADAIAAIFKYYGFEVLVPQTFLLFREKGIAWPGELLPALVAYFQQHPQAFFKLEGYLSDRFYWLVNQNVAWSAYRKEQTEDIIEKLKNADAKRIALLQYLAKGKEVAIGYLFNEWENFSSSFQAALLAEYIPEQSPLVDDFFKKVASEKHKDTFRYTLRYFSRTANAGFLATLQPHIQSLLTFHRKKLRVNEEAIKPLKSIFLKKHLPIFSLDKTYGFDANNSLFNFFSLVPLTFLCDGLDCTWPDFLASLRDGDELHELLLLGLIYSSSQRDIDQELILQTILSAKFPILEQVDLLPLYQNIPAEQLQVFYQKLKAKKFSFKDNAVEMLLLCPHFLWPDDLCKEVMKVLPLRLLNATDTRSDPNFILFRNMILNCDAEMYAYINATFQANPVYSWNSTKLIEKHLKILRMRWQIKREL